MLTECQKQPSIVDLNVKITQMLPKRVTGVTKFEC